MLQEALEHLVRGIVDYPEDVQGDLRNNRRGEMLSVNVHPDDLGRVIVRKRRPANALRSVVEGLAGYSLRVDVVDTARRRRSDEPNRPPNQKFSGWTVYFSLCTIILV